MVQTSCEHIKDTLCSRVRTMPHAQVSGRAKEMCSRVCLCQLSGQPRRVYSFISSIRLEVTDSVLFRVVIPNQVPDPKDVLKYLPKKGKEYEF